jgi:hypothetical protein
MPFQGRTLKTRHPITLRLSMAGALFAIKSVINLTTKQDRFDLEPTNTADPNNAAQNVSSENIDSMLD